MSGTGAVQGIPYNVTVLLAAILYSTSLMKLRCFNLLFLTLYSSCCTAALRVCYRCGASAAAGDDLRMMKSRFKFYTVMLTKIINIIYILILLFSGLLPPFIWTVKSEQ